MRFSNSVPLLAQLVSPAFSTSVEDFQSKCEALSTGISVKGYDGISVTLAQYLGKNTTLDLTAEGINTTCSSWIPNLPIPVNLCRLALHVPTSSSSEIIMEAWFPEKWSGRFVSTGNAGLGGCIQYPDLVLATSSSSAAVGNNNGHNGTSGGAFFHQPEVLQDYVWRALYASTIVGQDVTRQVYGTAHKKSYYFGCSSGGRQGLKAAQLNPEIFDGMVVGAPAIGLTGLFAHFANFLKTFGTDVNSIKVSIEQWMSVQQETLRQCDHLDGAVDGIVEDTRICQPDLSTLLCENHRAPEACLSRHNLSLVEQIFRPFSVDGHLVYPGIPHNGHEVFHIQGLLDGQPLTWANEWPRNVVYENASWNLSNWTPADALHWTQQNPFNVETWQGNLSAYRDRGAKIIHWHGEADEFIDVTQSHRYYAHVAHTMSASSPELDSFYRYFPISGLQHCWNGPGANNFGQTGFYPAPSGGSDNVLARIVEWVEEGRAPEFIRGTKFVGDDEKKGVAFTRRHCKFPARNVYLGVGNGTDEDGWHCVG